MEMVMCRSCGNFVPAIGDDEHRTPKKDRCPECDATEFEDIHTEHVVQTGD